MYATIKMKTVSVMNVMRKRNFITVFKSTNKENKAVTCYSIVIYFIIHILYPNFQAENHKITNFN